MAVDISGLNGDHLLDERENKILPEEAVEPSNEREKDLSGKFEDPSMDFLFSDDLEKSIA